MRWVHGSWFGALALALAAACGGTSSSGVGPGSSGSSGGNPAAPSGSLPCAVDTILAQNCRKCHSATPSFGAPMPLETLADLYAKAKSNPDKHVYEVVPERINDDASPMPQPPNERLSQADRDTLSSWAAQGAPADPTGCATPPPTAPPLVTPTACTPDLTLAPASPWTMPTASGDQYVCYGVDVTKTTPTHAVGFSPRIDNPKIVHHVLLYQADSAYTTTPQPCSAGGEVTWRMVTGWAPGGKGFEMPPEAGFPLATTGATHYVVQVHYSNPSALVGETDTSGFGICTGAPRANEADVMAFGTTSISIPPNAAYSRTCSVTVASQVGNVHLIASLPHMHKIGTAIQTTLTPADGSPPIDLGTMKNFSFNTQAWLPITGALAKPNDVITTKCEWKNTTGDVVKFGENTANEMCYSFTVYYPKVNVSIWNWQVPALASTCQ